MTPSLACGNDFAVGGAQTGTTPVHTANSADLPAKLAAFQSHVATPQSNAPYTLWIGSNDLNALFAALATDAIASTLSNISTDL